MSGASNGSQASITPPSSTGSREMGIQVAQESEDENEPPNFAQLDELQTFVGKKSQMTRVEGENTRLRHYLADYTAQLCVTLNR